MTRRSKFVAFCAFTAGASVHGIKLAPDGPNISAAKTAPWPTKGGNLNHSGLSPSIGPRNLVPAWIFEEPNVKRKGDRSMICKVFHASPMIDENFNTYIQSTTGWLYSINKDGQLNWEFDTGGTNPGNVALHDGAVYVANDVGDVLAINIATTPTARQGSLRWRSHIAFSTPGDTHSLTAVGDTLLTACNLYDHSISQIGIGKDVMNSNVCALRTKDGMLKWAIEMRAIGTHKDAWGVNHMHSVVGDSVIFSDSYGGLYRVSLETGRTIWVQAAATDVSRLARSHAMLPYGTTATSVMGPNDIIYNAFNTDRNVGVVQAHAFATGEIVWQQIFEGEINAAPAVGPVRPGGPLALVLAIGPNYAPFPATPEETAARARGDIPPAHGKLIAVDATTGKHLWNFTTPGFDGHVAGSHVDSDGGGTVCMPDDWGVPSIGADGVVYVNWSGGWSYALLDANGDGTVDLEDPLETSSYHHGFGSNGQTALAPGFAVAPTCRQVIAFKTTA